MLLFDLSAGILYFFVLGYSAKLISNLKGLENEIRDVEDDKISEVIHLTNYITYMVNGVSFSSLFADSSGFQIGNCVATRVK